MTPQSEKTRSGLLLMPMGEKPGGRCEKRRPEEKDFMFLAQENLNLKIIPIGCLFLDNRHILIQFLVLIFQFFELLVRVVTHRG